MMKQVNLQYEDRLRGEFRKSYSNEEAEDFVNLEREVAAKVAEIIGLKGIIVELVGRWIWVTGETFRAKAQLKSAGFWWASKKLAWYWHKPQDTCTSYGKKSLEQIRDTYGTTVLRGASQPQRSQIGA